MTMYQKISFLFGGMLLWIGMSTSVVWAQAPVDRDATPQPEQRVKLAVKKKKALKQGWFPKLSLGINGSLVHTSAVPGIENGLTVSFGAVLAGELLYVNKKHKWLTELKVLHTQARTPALPIFIKTADNLDLKTTYTYNLGGAYETGLFVGAQLTTALLPGELVLGADTAITIKNVKGEVVDTGQRAVKLTPFALTPAFAPLLLKQMAGVEFEPYESKNSELDLKISAAAQEVFASGLVAVDDAKTPGFELQQLQNYVQAGLQLNILFQGKLSKELSYAFSTELLYPIVTNVDTTLSGFDLLNADISFKVSMKLSTWASVDYLFRAQKIPLLSEKWQVVNNLVLSLTANIL